ncbi:MAG: 50S ribosomal protein L1 [Gemmatimonadota bacterium]|nr:MAG: 50S ribosomal protein L1 [Gemmatimonadota bacterium]
MKRSKRYKANSEKIDASAVFDLKEGIKLVKETASAHFDETVEVAAKLGVDPRHADQQVRGFVVLPHGTGRTVKILVLARGDKEKEALEAGADYAGMDDYIQKIKDGWTDVDVIIATPDVMSEVGKLGRILGPRGLMPNPKSGTVTFDVAKAVRDAKAGKVEYRVDKSGILHVPIGKASFHEESLFQNACVFLEAVLRAKPAAAKGQYVRSLALSSTMGPGIKLDRQAVLNLFR